MKNFKRFFIMFSIATLMFTTCVFAKTEYNYDKDSILTSVDTLVKELVQMNEIELEYYSENSLGWTSSAADTLLSYMDGDVLGKYKGSEKPVLKEDGQKLVVTQLVHFENTDLNVTTTLANITGSVSVVDIQFSTQDNGNTSLGAKMAKAAFNTLIGVVAVFLVLLLISFIISLFKYIPKIQEAFSRRKSGSAEAALESAIAQIEQMEERTTDDTELVAVITAAICASTGATSDSFVVRSIRRVNRRKR